MLGRFQNLKKLNLKGHQLDSLEETNNFLAIVSSFPQLEEIELDSQMSEIVMELFRNKKFDGISKTLRYVNGFDLKLQLKIHPREADIRYVMENIWKIANCYRLASEEQYDEQSIWYVMDELGSSFQHSEDPEQQNIKISPFMYARNNKLDDQVISYSLLLPLRDLKSGDTCYRDYLHGEQTQRDLRLSVWQTAEVPTLIQAYSEHQQKLLQIYLQNHEKISTYLKVQSEKLTFSAHIAEKLKSGQKVKILTDSEFVKEHLKLECVEFVNDMKEADVIFIISSSE